MSVPAPQAYLSPQEYLAGERRSPVKHEYVNGAVYAMSGASEQHNTLTINLATLLRPHVRGTPCRVFMADMKVRVKTARDERYYYPDLVVTCAGDDQERYWKARPKLIVEVLSRTTERTDRVEKFAAYRQLDSLEEYVLISQTERRVEIYRRADDWAAALYRDGGPETLRLDSVGLELSLAALYEDVAVAPEPADTP